MSSMLSKPASRPALAKTQPGLSRLGAERSREAKRLAAVILDVLAGTRTPAQAAAALDLSLMRYYQLESRALHGLVQACEPRPKGRVRSPASELEALRRQHERLQRAHARQQTLLRLSQRTLGLSPPPPGPASGKKRRRKPAVRALSVAARLQSEADDPARSATGQ